MLFTIMNNSTPLLEYIEFSQFIDTTYALKFVITHYTTELTPQELFQMPNDHPQEEDKTKQITLLFLILYHRPLLLERSVSI